MAFEVRDFLDLYTGVRYADSKIGTDECLEFCLNKEKLDRCTVSCEFAFIREILQIIKERHVHSKNGPAPETHGNARDPFSYMKSKH